MLTSDWSWFSDTRYRRDLGISSIYDNHPVSVSSIFHIYKDAKQFLHLIRNHFSIRFAGQFFGSDSHHLAHILRRSGTRPFNNSAKQGNQLGFSHLFGQVFFDNGSFIHFLLIKIHPVLRFENFGGFFPLFYQFLKNLHFKIGCKIMTCRFRFSQEKGCLYRPQGFQPFFLPGQHGGFQIVGDFVEEIHIVDS